MERHTSYADRPLTEFLEYVELNIAAMNRALHGIAPDRVRMHVCWGNYEAPHDLDVPLAQILPILYHANVGALVLEAANPRHQHEYRCFKEFPLPDHMSLITGVIDTKTNYVEHHEVVADRIERAANAIGDPRRVMAGTDCGFETSAGTRRSRRGDRVGEVARDARGRRPRLASALSLTRRDGISQLCHGSTRILACVSGDARSSNAFATPSTPTLPVISGSALTCPSARWLSVAANSSGA